MRSLAVFQLKGGVGKTTTAVNLAACAAQSGIRTLLWDLDPQGSASWLCGVDAQKKQEKIWSEDKPIGRFIKRSKVEKLDVIAGDLSLRKFHQSIDSKSDARKQMERLISVISEDYGFLLVDCPPALTSAIEGILKAMDRILVPVQPSKLSILAYENVKGHLDWVKKSQWLPFVTMIDRRKTAHIQWLEDEAKQYKDMLETRIGYSASAERMLQQREPIVCIYPPVVMAKNYQTLWEEIKPKLKIK